MRNRGRVMPISQDEGSAVRSTEPCVLDRPPKPVVGVVVRGGGDRSMIGEQLAHATVLRYLDSMDAAGEAMAGGPIDVVVANADAPACRNCGMAAESSGERFGQSADRGVRSRRPVDDRRVARVDGAGVADRVRGTAGGAVAAGAAASDDGRAAVECGAGDSAAAIAAGAVAASGIPRDRGAQGDEWAWSGSTRAMEPGVAQDSGAAARAIGVGDGAGGVADRAGAGRGVADVGAWVAGAADPAAPAFRACELHHASHAAISGRTDTGARAGGRSVRDRAEYACNALVHPLLETRTSRLPRRGDVD